MSTEYRTPEPRRFTDVRPDRHGWRWWRRCLRGDNTHFEIRPDGRYRYCYGNEGWSILNPDAWLDRTVIPTDEQGNPVSWESIGLPSTQDAWPTVPRMLQDAVRQAAQRSHDSVQRAVDSASPRPFFDAPASTSGITTSFSNVPLNAQPITQEGFRRALASLPDVPLDIPAELPRFTADELDDVDHSRTTKLDQTTLRRGKLPTVEQIAKYREVRARRNGTVADALKESHIDCEVAQYVLERWAGGLDNTSAHKLITWAVETTDVGLGLFICSADARVQQWIDHHNPTLDTTEPLDTSAQRDRRQAEERQQLLARLQAQLAAERATAQPQEVSEPHRFDLIEPDPQADPTASIRAWEARQAAAKREKAKVAAMPAKTVAVPRRPVIEVVDAKEGLSRFEVLCALAGRAMHGGC